MYRGTGVFFITWDRLFFKDILFSGYDLRSVVATVLFFLQQRNGALSMEILYFLAGSVMHHYGVVIIPRRCSSVRGWFK
ncbi:hypothetical protein GY509_000646 [Escherichia coli]|nr:hypothetical protein [Escherichia coli]